MATPVVRFLIDLATQLDAGQAAAMCEAAGLDAQALADSDGRVPRAAAVRLAEQLTRLAPHGSLGLCAYEQVHPGTFQEVGFAMMSSTTLHQALERLVRLAPLLDEAVTLQLRPDGGDFRLQAWEDAPMPAIMADSGLAALLGFCRFLSGGRGLPVLAAEFSQPAPPDLGPWRRLLPGVPLAFGRPHFSLLLQGEALHRPLHPVSPVLDQMHSGVADQQLEALRIDHLVSTQVQQFIVRQLREHLPTLDEAAAALRTAPRSLQRQLAREGRSFKQLLDDTRRQLAHQYLRHTPVSLKELAYLLGFDELGSLHRASQRWFGMPPARYRAQRAAAS
mgnify:CR=1 FL=1